jgi:hypothetical protein
MISHVTLSEADLLRPVVLCLEADQFVRDVKMLQKQSTKYAWPMISMSALVEAQKAWVPKRLQVQAYYADETGPNIDTVWEQSKKLCVDILRNILNQGAHLVAVMAGNWNYWHEEGMRLACEALDIPFIVLLREHYTAGTRMEDVREWFENHHYVPRMAGVAVAGQTTLDVMGKLGIVPYEEMHITGYPRLDAWRHPATPVYDRPIVLMSYFKGYNATDDFVHMMHVFAEMSRQHPHVPFVVKAKHGAELQHLQQISDVRGLNLTIIDTSNLPALICNARAVIGFYSLIVYETLLAPVRILIPCWGQTDQDPMRLTPSPGDERLRGHMEFLSSETALRQAVAESATADAPAPDMAARAKLFGEYFAYDFDRTAVERVEDFVAEFGRG